MAPAVYQSIEDARRYELERAMRLLRAGRDAAEVMEGLSRRLTNKLLHGPTRTLREGNPIASTS